MTNLFRSLSTRSRRNSTSSNPSGQSSSNSTYSVPVDINSAPILPGKRTLVVAASTAEFDPIQIQLWKDEGYHVHYCHVHGKGRSATYGVQAIGDELEPGQKYAIVAYGHAATLLLDQAFESLPKLCAFVAFYPSSLPEVNSMPRNNLNLQMHLAGDQPFAPKYPTFHYPNTYEGFNERNNPAYDRLASGLAWSRALDCVRTGFGFHPDLEGVWERHLSAAIVAADPLSTLNTMTHNPSLLNVPTLTGGTGQRQLNDYYTHLFIPAPPSLKITLVSRTVGSDKVVDEMFLTLRHTQEVPWLLPGVPATDRVIEIAVCSVVAIRGGKIEWERVYWDQASVLMQVELLDPRLGGMGGGRLPIVGPEAARKVKEGMENGTPFNELVKR